MSHNKIIIAVDGFSSSGKSTMAKALAAAIGYKYVDTGAMYRVVTLAALRHGLINDDKVDIGGLSALLPYLKISFERVSDGSQHTFLNGEDVESEIRGMEVSGAVSPIAAIPEVRLFLTAQQREMGIEKGIVMDGRDIGTTVFPNAEMKVFVTTDPEIRAKRRFKELQAKGIKVDFDEVLSNIRDRDRIDTTREISPLRKADDAVVLDNGGITPAQQLEWLIDLYNERSEKGE